MREAGVKGNGMDRSTGGIDNLKLPPLPFIRVGRVLGAKLLCSLYCGGHGGLDADASIPSSSRIMVSPSVRLKK